MKSQPVACSLQPAASLSFMEFHIQMHHVGNKKTMTSKEILQASLLEIVFDNRNKQYGAYTLRKFYENRLGIALAVALSSVFLLCLFISKSFSGTADLPVASRPVEIREILISPDQPKLPKVSAAKAARAAAKAPTLTTPVIVADQDVRIEMPTQKELGQSAMPNTGNESGDGDAKPGAAVVTTGNGEQGENQAHTAFLPESVQPEFPGGPAAWMAFLGKWLQVPEDMQPGERKTVLVSFEVGEDGSVTNLKIAQSAGSAFDNEVLRALKRMPKWKPAIQNGRKVATSFSQPVTFQSPEN